MATYLALIHDPIDAWDDPEVRATGHAAHQAFGEKHGPSLVGGAELAPDAVTIRRDGDAVTLTDGAFAEAKEVLGGYYAFTADDLDAALAIARDVPSLGGTVELRPTGTMTDGES